MISIGYGMVPSVPRNTTATRSILFLFGNALPDFTPKPGVPQGERFSAVYRERGAARDDSDRMRRRIAAVLVDYGDKFEKHAEAELGIETPWTTSNNWTKTLETWSLDDVLNIITVLVAYVPRLTSDQRKAASYQADLVAQFNRILEQENVSYRVDPQGGAHFLHDEEFARSAQSTITGLGDPRYANSLDRFESGMKAIAVSTPDGKTGIRNVFEAAEGLFRLIVPRAPRLTADQVGHLDPILQKRYAGDRTAAGAAAKLLASFKDWTESCHFYRHEPGKPDEIAQPPLELAIHLMSVGAAFIRVMVELDQSNQQP
jgi:hypothetical protein